MSGFLDRLREAGERATPGPWNIQGNSVMVEADEPYVIEEVSELASDARLPIDEDATFIVLARNLWPLLIDALAAAEEISGRDPSAIKDRHIDELDAALAALRAAVEEK